MNPNRIRSPRQAGFTMVELMVGMVIGLIAVVVMFQVFSVSEKFRRTTTGGGDAHQNAAMSIFLLERDGRMAGYGLNIDSLLGCTTRVWHQPSGTQVNFRLQPVYITDGVNGQPDEVTFVYGSSELAQFPGSMQNPYPAGGAGLTDTFRVSDSRFQFLPGDLVVAGEVPPANRPMKDCTGYQVTRLIDPNPGQLGDLVRIGETAYTDPNGVTKATVWNPPNGIVPAPFTINPYPVARWLRKDRVGGRLVDMGNDPTVVRYKIVNDQLVAQDVLNPGNTQVVADGIVQMQVQYGFSWNCPVSPAPLSPNYAACSIGPDALSDPQIDWTKNEDKWGDSMREPANPAVWRKVIAVRIALVSRSAESDRPDPVLGCATTTQFPIWRASASGAQAARPLNVSLNNPLGWKCYRYTVTEMTVPIRNLQWFPDMQGWTSLD